MRFPGPFLLVIGILKIAPMSLKVNLSAALAGAALAFLAACNHHAVRVTSLSCGFHPSPAGISPAEVNFSWKAESEMRDVTQAAFHLVVWDSRTKAVVWDPGRRESGLSLALPYEGPELQPATSYGWKVRIWDNRGNRSDWSSPASFITGLEKPEDWEGALWIGYDELPAEDRIVPGIHVPGFHPEWKNKPAGNHPLPLLRREFNVRAGLKEALVFVTGLGHYELRLNGEKVGDHFLSPGWTHYDSLCLYNVFDVTSMLKKGVNAAGVILGNGFYIVPNSRFRKLITAYGNPKMRFLLQLRYADGGMERVTSGTEWRTKAGPLVFSSIYGGECYDATREDAGWDKPGFDDSSWREPVPVQPPCGRLEAERDYPVRVMERLEPVKITSPDSSGRLFLCDFGQNASGIVEIRVRGNKGDTVRMTPGELVDSSGRVMQGATGKPYYLTYILRGGGTETWAPRFTYYGFRYLEVEGARPAAVVGDPSLPVLQGISMLHTRNSAPSLGTFHTSEELFNKINHLIMWAIRSNMQSVLTDCPHREKLGWLEQTFLMGNSIRYNFDIHLLYRKVIRDMKNARFPSGMIPATAPEFTRFDGGFLDSPEWGSAGIILPWLLWKWYGDRRPMEESWDMMTRYAAYLGSKAEGHILDFGLGDWYDLGPEPPGYAQLTPVALTATAVYYHDLTLLAAMAELLGRGAESVRYAALAEEVRQAFNRTFFDPVASRYATGSQTAQAMPLVLGLADSSRREAVFGSLVESVTGSGKALTAGDIGFHYLVRALSDGGAAGLLYEMNARDDVPGYGFQLKKGATALTESWAALERVSNNHLMLGHLMEWFFSGLAGINQTGASVAFRELEIAPQPAGPICAASATFESPYGTVRTDWRKEGERFELKLVVPVNATALVRLPVAEEATVREGGNPLPAGGLLGYENGRRLVRVGSGSYHFTAY